MKKVQIIRWILLLLAIGSFNCKRNSADCVDKHFKLNVAKWNQLTINSIIETFRIDTNYFQLLKQPPPRREKYSYSYPVSSSIFNNDIATIWNFINSRNLILRTVDSLQFNKGNLEVLEFYKFHTQYEFVISNEEVHYEILLDVKGNLTIRKVEEIPVVMDGLVDNRQKIEPIRTLTIRSIICLKPECNDSIVIKTLYIDSSEN
jgi:hypothetical protein